MYALTTLAYPVLLAALCLGAALLVDRAAGSWLPAAVLPAIGAAALIALTQLASYFSPLAPVAPYLVVALAAAGAALGRARLRRVAGRWGPAAWEAGPPLAVYLLALAPVIVAGRATFSSYLALADSAVHMAGADYLLQHGHDFAGLDLHSSYGQTVNAYYNASYPSGADTLFGASAWLLGLPLIWAFQPFNAFMLAVAVGPARLLAERCGLSRPWAALAAVCATLSAIVYGFELLGSVKEVTALAMILTLGALVSLHTRWLAREQPARRALPMALVIAAGVSALGLGFAAWALAAGLVLIVPLAQRVGARAQTGARPLASLLGMLAGGAFVVLACALPTWADLSGSLHVSEGVASTSNPGNLHAPLRTAQVLGVWLRGSYKQQPAGAASDITYALIALALGACALGAVHLLRRRRLAPAAWIAAMLVVWLAVSVSATTWVRAKALMLTSPAVVLLAWCGVAALLAGVSPGAGTRAAVARGGAGRHAGAAAMRLRAAGALAAVLALALAGGTLASDFMQYRASNLAPTARYDELGSLNGRFAGRGPALFTDFDEYALYELRDLDVAGPSFAYPPPAAARMASGRGTPVDLDRAPGALRAYPLIVTRRDPTASPPSAAYRLLFEGAYYEAWGRRRGVAGALEHRALAGSAPARCAQLERMAGTASARGLRLVAALGPQLAGVDLAAARRPSGWARSRGGLVMSRPGTLTSRFTLPRSGTWQLWLQGQFMPPLALAVDGRRVAPVAGELGGNSLVPDTAAPLPLRLAAGKHRLTVTRGSYSLAPGSAGSAVLARAFLTPAGAPTRRLLTAGPGGVASSLCRLPLRWAELERP
jgi:hypothetical protein